MSDLTLPVQPRTEDGRGPARRLRAQGRIPAVIYGKHRSATHVSVAERDFLNLKRAIGNRAKVIQVQENGDSCQAIIQEAQRHPITDKFLHVDLMTVTEDRKIRALVPVEPVGEAVGVRTEKGTLNRMVRTLEVECMPKDLPERIEVDVTELHRGEGLQIGKITPPEGCVFKGRPDIVVFVVTK
ncbi:MAG: 50S ribosomal protein L25 [Opitutales bacterium]